MKKQSEIKVSIQKASFNADKILQQVQPLKIFRRQNEIITKYQDQTICKAQLSTKYGILDFSNLIEETLPIIEKSMQPVSYSLDIFRGVQQLKIYSKKFADNDEIYQRMFTIFSSSNGNYPMLFNAGLFRQVCSNGLMVNTHEALSVKTKHYQAAIEHKILSLKKALPLFESEIEEQLLFLKRLNKETISLRKVYARLLQSKEAEPRKSAIKRIENLSNMLLSSPTDALKLNLSFEQKRSLNRPIELVEATKSTADIEIPKIQILNCYTESYNKRLHAVNWRENQRIKEILISD